MRSTVWKTASCHRLKGMRVWTMNMEKNFSIYSLRNWQLLVHSQVLSGDIRHLRGLFKLN